MKSIDRRRKQEPGSSSCRAASSPSCKPSNHRQPWRPFWRTLHGHLSAHCAAPRRRTLRACVRPPHPRPVPPSPLAHARYMAARRGCSAPPCGAFTLPPAQQWHAEPGKCPHGLRCGFCSPCHGALGRRARNRRPGSPRMPPLFTLWASRRQCPRPKNGEEVGGRSGTWAQCGSCGARARHPGTSTLICALDVSPSSPPGTLDLLC